MIGPAGAQARLREAGWLKDPALQEVFDLLDGEEGATRAVGGLVRDTLLGRPRPETDIDLATVFTPEEVGARASAAGIAVHPTGIAHGTLTLRHGGLTVEVTTLRRDVETDGRHALVRFGTDWAADAARRDFTLNALYADRHGTLFDPLEGLMDCLEGRVRFIGDAGQRIAEDGLRVYRFFRFTASHGAERFDPDGLNACAEAAGRLGHLSAERVGVEMRKMLGLPRIAQVLGRMTRLGILDLSETALMRLRTYERQVGAPVLAARLAIMTDADPAADLRARWRLSNEEVRVARDLVAGATLIEEMRLYEAVHRHPAILAEALDVASVRAGWTEAGKAVVREALLTVDPRPFPVSGDDLLARGFTAGPALGAALERLERDWIESGFALDREALLARAGPG